jgi:hypothetical protein
MACAKCQDIVDRQDLPHCIRTCPSCGRIMYVHEPGEGGHGVLIRAGDQFVIPAGWLKLSANPLRSSGHMFKPGLAWFAELIFVENLPSKKDVFPAELDRLETLSDDHLRKSSLLQGLSIDRQEDADKIIDILEKNRQTSGWWAFLCGVFLNCAKKAITAGDSQQTAWAVACAERSRSMWVFKEHLEEVVWMGQSARRLVDLLRTWDNNTSNNDESFWQETFKQNSYALSQVFSVPVVFIRDKAYVGGMNIDGTDAKFVDYLFSSESSNEAILVEIKTPTTRLLGSQYRGVYKPSPELTGSTIQVLDYRDQLARNLDQVTKGTDHNIKGFQPKCLLIAGNGKIELDNDVKRRSFELFRSQLRDVEIVTYDELFRKVEVLATLFNLVRKKVENEGSA